MVMGETGGEEMEQAQGLLWVGAEGVVVGVELPVVEVGGKRRGAGGGRGRDGEGGGGRRVLGDGRREVERVLWGWHCLRERVR